MTDSERELADCVGCHGGGIGRGGAGTCATCGGEGVVRRRGRLGAKAMAVLRIASLPILSIERQNAYNDACSAYSEKAVLKKFEDLESARYIDCGVSARTGWLTDKGKEMLNG